MNLAAALLPVTQADVSNTYQVTDTLPVDNARTTVRFQLATATTDGTKVMYFVCLYTSRGQPLLDKDLERWLCDRKQLLSQTGRSKVAVRVRFYVRRNFHQKGLATYIVDREENLFRRWGAKEIQVFAMDLGRWVWTRERFRYSIPPFDFGLTQQRYREWQRATGVSKIRLATCLSDFPKEFLLSPAVGTLPLFKSL